MSKTLKIGRVDVDITGKFQLEIRTDKSKFRMTNIQSFVPFGKTVQDKICFMSKSGLVDNLFLDKVVTTFDPNQHIDAHNINTLIQHPDVEIDGLKDGDHKEMVRLNLKKSNCKYVIRNIDKIEDTRQEESIDLIKLRARLYSDEKPISKEQLIWLASNFEIPYRTEIQDEVKYKRHLQSNIDKFLQGKKENRDTFKEALDNMKLTEMRYYIHEFVIMGFVVDVGGIYKVGAKPIGASLSRVIEHFDNNPEEFQAYKNEVIQRNSQTVLS